jgi:hypothetical protein
MTTSLSIFDLREKSREGRNDFVSNKVVYLPKSVKRNVKNAFLAEKYLSGELWFEFHLTCPCEREGHVEMIVKRAMVANVSLPVNHIKGESHSIVGAGRDTMFVQSPESIELPDGIMAEGVYSVIRLKAIQDSCDCGWVQIAPLVVCPEITETGKADVSFVAGFKRPARVKMGQSPCELVKTRAKATQEISKQHRDDLRGGCWLNREDVERLFKISLFGDGVGLEAPFPHGFFKEMEMFVRPSGFHLHEHQTVRDGVSHDTLSAVL